MEILLLHLAPRKYGEIEKLAVERSSQNAPYSPFLCSIRLIVSSSCIQRLMEVDFHKQHAIFFDAGYPFLKLSLKYTHTQHYHHGFEYLRSIMQENYTIQKLGSSFRSIKRHCPGCRYFQAVNMQATIVSDLPKERLDYQSPLFSNTGVVYFSPFHVSVKPFTEKDWHSCSLVKLLRSSCRYR